MAIKRHGRIENLSERIRLAKEIARCDGEETAVIWEGFEQGQAECGNCGQAFPPERDQDDGRRIWCSRWEEHESALYFCQAWVHPNDHAAGIAPDWAEPYTRKRKVYHCSWKTLDESIPVRH